MEIIESHHSEKIDAPSGTAIRLGEAIAKTANLSLKENGVFHREGNTNRRKKNEIGFSTIRGGDIVGDHTVLFAGDGERIELTHKAGSRSTFAIGAIKAVKFLSNHETPEDIELYFCGPPLMNQAVIKMAEDWGIPDENVRWDDFGG